MTSKREKFYKRRIAELEAQLKQRDERIATLEEQVAELLKVNGKAIYNTRPWQTFGEGPTRNIGGGFSERKDKPFTSEDIRFTRSKDGKTIYAVVLDWPGTGTTVTIQSLADKPGAVDITDVKLLGHNGKLNWKRNQAGLKIQMPSKKPCEYAFVFKITCSE